MMAAGPDGCGSKWLRWSCTCFYIRKLSSGRILLIYHDSTSKEAILLHTFLKMREKPGNGSLLLDERDNVSYPMQ